MFNRITVLILNIVLMSPKYSCLICEIDRNTVYSYTTHHPLIPIGVVLITALTGPVLLDDYCGVRSTIRAQCGFEVESTAVIRIIAAKWWMSV